MRRQPVDLVLNPPRSATAARKQSAWLRTTSTLVRSVSFERADQDGGVPLKEQQSASTQLAVSTDMLLASTLTLEVGPIQQPLGALMLSRLSCRCLRTRASKCCSDLHQLPWLPSRRH